MNAFNRKDINIEQLRANAIYLLEASGFETNNRPMPEIKVDATTPYPHYLVDSNTIVLTANVATGPAANLERTLVHELAHSVQPDSLLGFDLMPYHMRECERQAYYVQYMYELRQNCRKVYLGGLWGFLEKYGNRKWFKEQYRVACDTISNNPTVVNHKDINSVMADALSTAMDDNPFFKN